MCQYQLRSHFLCILDYIRSFPTRFIKSVENKKNLNLDWSLNLFLKIIETFPYFYDDENDDRTSRWWWGRSMWVNDLFIVTCFIVSLYRVSIYWKILKSHNIFYKFIRIIILIANAIIFLIIHVSKHCEIQLFINLWLIDKMDLCSMLNDCRKTLY